MKKLASGDMNLYGYVGGRVLGSNDPDGLKVYWCARDVDFLVGGGYNHGFLYLVPDKPKDFPKMGTTPGGTKVGCTCAGFEEKGKLVCKINQKADCAAVDEKFGTGPKYKKNWDVDCNLVTASPGMTGTGFIRLLLKRASYS